MSQSPLFCPSAEWVGQLEAALIRRDVRQGFALLDAVLLKSTRLDPDGATSISFVLCMAQWADLGYKDPAFFKQIYAAVCNLDQAKLSALDFFKMLLMDAYVALTLEQLELCLEKLTILLEAATRILPEYLTFVAHFWKGRAHRKRAEYEEAKKHILQAQAIAAGLQSPQLVAVTQIHESWLAFQRGERIYAFQLLDSAEKVLRPTGHALSLGNIESARGRFIRRSGEYKRALGHFEVAIRIYRESCPDHPNLARALVNAAYVTRLVALQAKARRGGDQANGAAHAKSNRIAQEALALLNEAGKIYSLHHHQGGTGSVLVNAAQLHLERGAIDEAEIEAKRALELAGERCDQILLARAHIVYSAVCLARAEEQLGGDLEIELQANLAVQYADVAIALGQQMQNKRLLADAHIARGFAAAADFFSEWQVAKDQASRAAALLSVDDRDHLAQLLGDLRVKIFSKTKIEETLLLWSLGELGTKTFQQVQEEFAELVIPKVWLKCGKNVTLVAKALSVSPKKIRRILRNVEAEKYSNGE